MDTDAPVPVQRVLVSVLSDYPHSSAGPVVVNSCLRCLVLFSSTSGELGVFGEAHATGTVLEVRSPAGNVCYHYTLLRGLVIPERCSDAPII